jgi:hypothetical protein
VKSEKYNEVKSVERLHGVWAETKNSWKNAIENLDKEAFS